MRHTPDTPPASANGPPALPGPSHIKNSINPPAPPPPNRCPWTGPSRRAERPPRKNSWHPLWAPICCAVAAGGGGHPFWDGCCVAPPPPPCMCIYIYRGGEYHSYPGFGWPDLAMPLAALALALAPLALARALAAAAHPLRCCSRRGGSRRGGSRTVTAAETSEREGGRSKGLTRDRSKGFTRDHSGSLNRFHCRRGTVAAVALSAGSCCSCCNCGQRGRLRCAVAAVGGDRSHGFVEDRREKREKTVDFAARPNLGQAQ